MFRSFASGWCTWKKNWHWIWFSSRNSVGIHQSFPMQGATCQKKPKLFLIRWVLGFLCVSLSADRCTFEKRSCEVFCYLLHILLSWTCFYLPWGTISASNTCFAAILHNGHVVTWGENHEESGSGGNPSAAIKTDRLITYNILKRSMAGSALSVLMKIPHLILFRCLSEYIL